MTNVRVVAAVVDTKQLTLYTETGSTVLIPQGDPRLRPILDEITPIISQPGGVATVSLKSIDSSPYRDYEEQTGGLTRFFRVAKKKVASFFGGSDDGNQQVETVAPTQVGTLPALSTAIDDIIAHATPVANDDFSTIKNNETVVAVVGSGTEARVIPGMENLKGQFTHALKLGSTKAVDAFLKRLSAVIDQRQHSIHDLLRFMERGDLPIAEDGSIIIYKVLNRSGSGRYVDCHSRKVQQRVGSYVCMAPEMVDPNRRNECSNGLHVARRGYLSGFAGDVCVLAKVTPEDVIAVPSYDANKMRVCGYHILFELDQESFNKLRSNKPMTDNPKAQALLGRAISGHHPAPIEEVRITGQRGQGVVITPMKGNAQQPTGKIRKATAIEDEGSPSAPAVDPRQVAEQVTEAKAAIPASEKTVQGNTRTRTARALLDNGDIQELVAFKKKSKVSWASLGIDEEEQAHILKMMAAVPAPAPKPATKQPATVKAPAKKAAPVRNKPIVPAPLSQTAGRKERLYNLDKVYSNGKADPRHRALAASEMLDIRRKAKKSWAALGYPDLTDQLLSDNAAKLQKQANAVAAVAQPVTAPAVGTNEMNARRLFQAKDWTGLRAFQRSKKKGFSALGFTEKEIAEIKLHIGG